MSKKIVYVDVVGDIFHYGHCRYFEQARQFGDYLLVGVLDDKVCEGYKRLPYLNQKERIESISYCKLVDKVIGVETKPTKQFIKEHNIAVVCHGDDIDDETRKSWYKDAIELKIYKETKYTKTISTSNIIERIKAR